ncbi:MAG: prepilin-type N-terminal cleavage/methylation domain-containing protein [Leptospirillia bacterium]
MSPAFTTIFTGRLASAGRGSRGFTLLEVMVALGILATALVALLGLRNRDVAMQAHAREVTRATLLAQQVLFEAEMQDEPALGIYEGDFGVDYPGVSWQRSTSTFMIDRVHEVRVTILWGTSDRLEITRFVEAQSS